MPGSSSYHLESPYPASIGYLVEAREVPRKKEGERAPGTSGSIRGGSDAYPATSNNHRTACINCQLLPALVKHLISFLPVPAVAATASPTRPFFRSRPGPAPLIHRLLLNRFSRSDKPPAPGTQRATLTLASSRVFYFSLSGSLLWPASLSPFTRCSCSRRGGADRQASLAQLMLMRGGED